MSRNLNKVFLIGNVTKDPILKVTPGGVQVCTIGLATDRSWTTDAGEKHEETEFHRVVAWHKLAEIMSNFLKKGTKVHIEGRLSTKKWINSDGQERQTSEIVATDMIVLSPKPVTSEPMIENEDDIPL